MSVVRPILTGAMPHADATAGAGQVVGAPAVMLSIVFQRKALATIS